MGLVVLTPYVDGNPVTAAGKNANEDAIVAQVNGLLDTSNIQTRFVDVPIDWYLTGAVAAGNFGKYRVRGTTFVVREASCALDSAGGTSIDVECRYSTDNFATSTVIFASHTVTGSAVATEPAIVNANVPDNAQVRFTTAAPVGAPAGLTVVLYVARVLVA